MVENIAVGRFERWLPPEGIELLKSKPEWWQDLLACRFRVGDSTQPLLLAIRGGYMNAYVEGQSILKIGFKTVGKNTRISGNIHHKYVLPNASGQKYLEFDGLSVGGNAYEGTQTLDTWVQRARTFVRREQNGVRVSEKEGVAVIVANNPNVIDVEMGQNATGDRIDIVALEQAGQAVRIVFYEAKLFKNSALRADDLKPKVLAQLERYRTWINSEGRKDEIREAYRNTCQLLMALNATRDANLAVEPDPLIRLAAAPDTRLEVDDNPRLIIFGYAPSALNSYWTRHEAALREHGVRLLMSAEPRDIVLPRNAAASDL